MEKVIDGVLVPFDNVTLMPEPIRVKFPLTNFGSIWFVPENHFSNDFTGGIQLGSNAEEYDMSKNNIENMTIDNMIFWLEFSFVVYVYSFCLLKSWVKKYLEC